MRYRGVAVEGCDVDVGTWLLRVRNDRLSGFLKIHRKPELHVSTCISPGI